MNESDIVDAARFNSVAAMKWQVCFNDRIGEWTVQSQHQVVGCIGRGRLRGAIARN